MDEANLKPFIILHENISLLRRKLFLIRDFDPEVRGVAGGSAVKSFRKWHAEATVCAII
jgi:hypothetical protein